MKMIKTVSMMIDTNEDLAYKVSLANLKTFVDQATVMSDSDFPQVEITVEELQSAETYLIATYEVFP